MILNRKTMNFIIQIYNNGGTVTKRTQYMHALQYYTMCWHLRDSNIIREKGLNKEGQKIWELTEKGKKLAELLVKVNGVLDEQ